MKDQFRCSKKYMQSVSALYGSGEAPKAAKRKPKDNEEEREQIRLVNWLDEKGILFYAIGNERHGAIQGAKFKRQGVKAGVPDICLPIPRWDHHGLYIELKRVSGGIVSDSQQVWLDKLNHNGYLAVICHGCEEAQKVIAEYLGLC